MFTLSHVTLSLISWLYLSMHANVGSNYTETEQQMDSAVRRPECGCRWQGGNKRGWSWVEPPPPFSYFFHFCILISFLFYVKERDERANFN